MTSSCQKVKNTIILMLKNLGNLGKWSQLSTVESDNSLSSYLYEPLTKLLKRALLLRFADQLPHVLTTTPYRQAGVLCANNAAVCVLLCCSSLVRNGLIAWERTNARKFIRTDRGFRASGRWNFWSASLHFACATAQPRNPARCLQYAARRVVQVDQTVQCIQTRNVVDAFVNVNHNLFAADSCSWDYIALFSNEDDQHTLIARMLGTLRSPRTGCATVLYRPVTSRISSITV